MQPPDFRLRSLDVVEAPAQSEPFAPPDGVSHEEWVGSQDWAEKFRWRLINRAQKKTSADSEFRQSFNALIKSEGFQSLTTGDGQPLTPELLLHEPPPHGCGKTDWFVNDIIDVVVEEHGRPRQGGDRRSESFKARIDTGVETPGWESRSHLARRLADNDPDTWEAYQRGEYRSVHAAAKDAGLVRNRHKRDPYLAQDTHKAAQRLIDVFGPEWCHDLCQALREALDV